MTKLSDFPEVVKLVKVYRQAQEAIEMGEDYHLTVKGTPVIPVHPSTALQLLNDHLIAISSALNTYGVDTSV